MHALIALTLLAAPRPITLDVDLSDPGKHVYHARMVVPVVPGPLSLLYPKWLPGEHAPNGPIADLAGVIIEGGGKRIPWTRDPKEMFRFQLTVPPGVETLTVDLDYLSPPPEIHGYSAGSSADPELSVVSWNTVLLYPEGKDTMALPFRASLTLPAGWKAATALPVESSSGNRTRFETVSLETLVDSPVLCGAHFKEWSLGTVDGAPHYFDAAADSEAALDLRPEQVTALERLVREANALFGARHYRSYRFLTTLSDETSHGGLEHHQSSDDRVGERTFLEGDSWRSRAGLWPHEMTHSWNGKFRRPKGLVTGDFILPYDDSLLWVYEGLTTYWGEVLTARMGAWTPEYFRDYLAFLAQDMKNHPGRRWRPLEDTAVAAQVLYGSRSDGSSWRRSVDYYPESLLVWLEVDGKIREATGEAHSLDDFAKAFYGPPSGAPEVKPYSFDDVVTGLSAVAPGDWKKLLDERLTATVPDPPLEGITLSGWRLAWANTAGAFQQDLEKAAKRVDLSASLGLYVDAENGRITEVVHGSPADKAGIAGGSTLLAVNGRKLTPDRLREALAASKEHPIELIVSNADFYRTVKLDYDLGGRYPRLERIPGTRDRLSEIIAPRAPR